MNLQFDPERIKALRARLGFTQQQLANEIGVTQPAVAQWETGQSQPGGASVLEKLIHLEQRETEEATA